MIKSVAILYSKRSRDYYFISIPYLFLYSGKLFKIKKVYPKLNYGTIKVNYIWVVSMTSYIKIIKLLNYQIEDSLNSPELSFLLGVFFP